MALSYQEAFAALRMRQAYPLPLKIALSQERIHQYVKQYGEGGVYIGFSGNDSLVVLDLVRGLYPQVPAIFNDTGTDLPEHREYIRATPNLTVMRPRLTFQEVIRRFGYPVVSKEVAHKIWHVRHTQDSKIQYRLLRSKFAIPKKHQYLIDAPFQISSHCCEVLKVQPARRYERATGRVPFLGIRAAESRTRQGNYLKYGCNQTMLTRPVSLPIAFWTAQDVLDYIAQRGLCQSPVYAQGYKRTGCYSCGFGVDKEPTPNRFQLLASSHPALYAHCMTTLGWQAVCEYMSIQTTM